jgi:hypothetical protein
MGGIQVTTLVGHLMLGTLFHRVPACLSSGEVLWMWQANLLLAQEYCANSSKWVRWFVDTLRLLGS